MSKAKKWLAVLCVSASAISTVSAYNLFFSSNTADQISHETAKQKPPNKPCELESANADNIRPECRPGVKPSVSPPPPPHAVEQWKRGISWPQVEKNIDIYPKKSPKPQVENIANNKFKQDDNNKKVAIPNISIQNPKINNAVLEQQSKDFVSCLNEHFAISKKKVRKNYTEAVAGRLEFLNHSKKNSSRQNIKDFSQQFNSLIPDSETQDFVSMIGGTSFQKGNTDNDITNGTVSPRGEKKSNYQKIREISEQFNALSKDFPQNDTTFDTININTLKKQKFQECDSATSKNNKRKSNNQKIKDLKNQLSENAFKNNGDSDSLSNDGKALKHSNYSFDDDNSSSNSVFNVETENINVDNIPT